ncbi:MATE family efflux transporter [Sharpea porci]|uniref:MATE family efflux transporter n=1 Tax=Sharpea porci TaxID=2652286 RepID=UPI002A90D218|nr:MATE family efflux transporter [Sharpea porci]MDY5278853.1 MATE family efflux transporter [Sharpea porci]
MHKELLIKLRNGDKLTIKDSIRLTIQISLPAIMSQISTIVMEYADASMVGRLGAHDSASIGLVSSSTWLIGGLLNAASLGFSVQLAHRIGAKDNKEARNIMKIGLFSTLLFSFIMLILALSVAKPLPIWLGGNKAIVYNASVYFMIFACQLPFQQLNNVAGGMLQASGNMKTPSLLNILMCLLNILFNLLLIFPSGTVGSLPGWNLGVAGAALGTAFSQAIISLIMLYWLLRRSEMLKLRKGEKMRFSKGYFISAFRIALPVALEQIAQDGAQIVSTRIVAPLGTKAIAANSFSVTAESLCYMPGYGIGVAATTMIGQSIGAKRKDLTYRLGWLVTILGMAVMSITGVLMYLFAPFMLATLTPDPSIQQLGVRVLRIEAFAEPLFAASIVATGVLRGTGNTMVPSLFTLISMWLVRLPLAALLSPRVGLVGVWSAMAIELSVRGLLFLWRLSKRNWSTKEVITAQS